MDEVERKRMLEAVRLYDGIARSMQLAVELLPNWVPVRVAVREVCGVEWERLSHSVRTLVGASVRDWFAKSFPEFALTPMRLLPKTSSGKGSHMIAIYPIEWLIARRAHLARLLGDNPPVATLLPFEDEVARG